jgi:chromosome partitioning protein
MSKIIIIGNEKGGSGKTTTAMHLIISLLKLGFKVGSIDIDSRQKSLTRYVENRAKTLTLRGDDSLLMPQHVCVNKVEGATLESAIEQEEKAFNEAMQKLNDNDFIIVDTPGSDSALSRKAHSIADMVITPINDSFIDLDLIGIVEAQNFDQAKPGIYSAMLWEQKMKRAATKSEALDWVVVRNRLSTLDAINKRNVENALARLSKRFGFRIVPGFSDRVIFKELFLNGLTLHDANSAKEIKLNTSVVAARQELRNFVTALNIPEINEKLEQESMLKKRA